MRKFIIINTNPNRECYYHGADGVTFDSSVPFWLAGDYVSQSAGDTTNDITRAHLYNKRDAAERQVRKLTDRYSVGGSHFVYPQRDWQRARYPDSVGKKGYAKLVPVYEVREVEVSVAIVE